MSPAARVRLLVAAAAVVAAGVVVGVVLATRQSPPSLKPVCADQHVDPLIVPGVRSQNVAAVRAAMQGSTKQAVDRLEPYSIDSPKDPVVQFNYGLALLCTGYLGDAADAFRAAKTNGRDTFYEMRADEILHPQYFQPPDGLYPLFVPQGHDPLLERGSLLQREGHQHSAERVFARAARLRPDDAQAQVAAAVARFDEDDLSAAFSRLGPLARRFPHSQSVHFHLGLLLAWIRQRGEAVEQFRLARADGPHTELGREADAFLTRLVTGGTKG